METEKLRHALVEAGAESIVVSEAHVSAGDSDSINFRGHRNDVVFTERLRVEVLAPADRTQAVLDALNRHSIGRRSGFVQQSAEPLAGSSTPSSGS
jgi:ammonium transporter, Amt family